MKFPIKRCPAREKETSVSCNSLHLILFKINEHRHRGIIMYWIFITSINSISAFCPYHIGHFALVGAKMDHLVSMKHKHRTLKKSLYLWKTLENVMYLNNSLQTNFMNWFIILM